LNEYTVRNASEINGDNRLTTRSDMTLINYNNKWQ